jgi:hypothetical protein
MLTSGQTKKWTKWTPKWTPMHRDEGTPEVITRKASNVKSLASQEFKTGAAGRIRTGDLLITNNAKSLVYSHLQRVTSHKTSVSKNRQV